MIPDIGHQQEEDETDCLCCLVPSVVWEWVEFSGEYDGYWRKMKTGCE